MNEESPQNVPLCVDLDGTLLKTDTLWESLILLFKETPRNVWRLPGWLLQGKAAFKQAVARATELDVTILPYRTEILEYIRAQRTRGRKLVLATAADKKVAMKVADFLGVFDEVVASDGKRNLSSSTKAVELVKRYGKGGFEYIGDSVKDVAVWKQSAGAYLVTSSSLFQKRVRQSIPVKKVFSGKHSIVAAFWQTLRPYQWVKNTLVFIPLAMAHQLTDPKAFLRAVIAWGALCAVASSLYIINDLLDLAADRRHYRKRYRPLARGDLAVPHAVAGTWLLWIVAIGLAFLLPPAFRWVLLLYALGSFTYSFYFKQVVLIDVLLLSALYTIRLVAGSEATGVPISFWLLTFSVFFFLSLALVKRCAELLTMAKKNESQAAGRSYRAQDFAPLATLGACSGFLSVLVLAFYMNSEKVAVLYERPAFLWLICGLLLYWISRVWLFTYRSSMHEDPIIFAFKDRVSYLVGVATLCLLILAL